MSIREHPTKPGRYIIDCRPDGYKGKRQRIEISGSKEEALAFEREIMRRHVDIPITRAVNHGGNLSGLDVILSLK